MKISMADMLKKIIQSVTKKKAPVLEETNNNTMRKYGNICKIVLEISANILSYRFHVIVLYFMNPVLLTALSLKQLVLT